MKQLKLLLAIVAVGIAVAVTFVVFEGAVSYSITLIWERWLHTNTTPWIVLPVCLVLSLLYFGLQHYLDRTSEHTAASGLGEVPNPTLTNFSKILFIGFWSLVAGASLGPEAILVPACIVIGAFIGKQVRKDDPKISKLLAVAGFIALFTAFFNNFVIGFLSLFLAKRKMQFTINLPTMVMAALVSLVTAACLHVLGADSLLIIPDPNWQIKASHIISLVLLVVAGAGTTILISEALKLVGIVHKKLETRPWIITAVIASVGLSALYIAGGSLVRFTGNESIVPLLHEASTSGILGILWVFVIKVAAIGWSKAMHYRGGLIFPSIFLASALVAILQQVTPSLSFGFGLIAVLIGLLAMDQKTHTLF